MYELIKRDGLAKRGKLHTVHGVVETPVFMNVGTVAAIKGAVSTEDLEQIGTQVELSNTYHLHVRPGDQVELHILGDPVHRRCKIQSLRILECPCAVPLVEGQLEGFLRDVRLLGGNQHLREAAGGEGVGGGGGQGQSQGQRQGRGGRKAAFPLVQHHIVAPPEGKISPGAQRKGSGGTCGLCRTKKPYHRFWNVPYYTEENGEMQEIRLELLDGNFLEDCKQQKKAVDN